MSKIFRFLLGGDKEEDKKNEDQNNSTTPPAEQQQSASSQQPVAEPPKTPQKLSSASGSETLSAEEMRLRRLRMYGGAAQPATSPPPKQPQPQQSSSKPIEIKPTTTFLKPEEPKKAASFQESSNLSPQQVSKPVAVSLSPAKAPIISSKPEFMSTSPMEVSPLSSSEPVSEKRKALNAEEKLIHEGVMKIFRVTLQGKSKSSFEFLPNMYSHLVNSGQSTHFTDDLTESVIVERMNLPFEENQTSLTYLLGCYTRCNEEIQKESKRKEKKEVVVKALEHMKRLIISYFGIVLLDDGIFPKQSMTKEEGPLQLIPFLLAETSFTSTNLYDMSDDFFGEFVEKTNPQDLQQIFTPIYSELSKRIANMTLVNRVIPILTAVARLLRYKELAKIMVSHPAWLPNIKTGKALELFSLLGPFFTLTTYYDKPAVAEKYFGQASRLSQQGLNQATSTLRGDLKAVYDNLHKIVYLLLKDKDTREPVIQWLAIAVEGNRLRSRMQDDFISSSSEGFMTNLTAVLLKLSEPFLDVKKLTINPDFPMLNTLVNFKEDVKLKASEKEAIEWYEKNKKGEKKEFAFTTQCFFLAYRALKLGYLKTVEKYHRVLSSIREAQRELERANKHGSLPPYEVQKLREEIDKLLVIRWGAEAALLDPQLHSMIFKFYNYASAWLVSKADPQGKGYPLQAPPPMEWCCLPEFLVDNIADFLLFVSKLCPTSVVGAPMEEINNLMVMLVGNSQFVQNPYVRAKFPEVWVSFIPPSDEKVPLLEQNATIIFNYKSLRQNLMNGILQLYVDMEHTGASTQFYDKFTPRYYISIMLKYLWVDKGYKEAFIKETQRNNAKEFLRFFNMLLNDAIYLLDESLKHLQEIRQYQTDRADTSFWNALPENQQREREMNNVQAERRVTNYMLLAKEYVHMLSYLSRDDPQPFLRPEMKDRVAAMLNYFLVELAGPTCQNLKVKNAEKYHFDPKYLLTEITDTYVHFSKFEEFTNAVAGDERSFRPEVFEKVAQILRKIGRRPESYIKEFEAFAVRAMEQAEKAMHVDQDLGEAPEEYLDPITYTLMVDPVKLPSSGVVVDRATIERHLLNDQKDPFNRAPLTVEALVPLPELKQQIEQWKNSKTKH